jgi:hypothetical protein
VANRLYDKGRSAFARKLIDWINDSVSAVLVDTGAYTPNFSTDTNLSDIPGGARIATTALANKTEDGTGVCDADDATFTSVPGTSVEAVVLYLDTGNPATSRLIAYIDDGGFPATVTIGTVTITFNNGANKIFKL